MKALTQNQQILCRAFDELINRYYAGCTAAFIRSEGGDDSNVSKMRRGIISVSERYHHLFRLGSCSDKANGLK